LTAANQRYKSKDKQGEFHFDLPRIISLNRYRGCVIHIS
jgi:hypothetical protein